MAEAETVGYAMLPSWEIWDDIAGHRSWDRCRCNCGSGWHTCATWQVRRCIAGIRQAVLRIVIWGCGVLVW